MPTGPFAGPGEDPHQIVEYVRALGHAISLEQLDRLHRRRLVPAPTGGAFPPGTAERVARIAELRATTRQFDELAWRLWWEGFAVERLLVRSYLERRAARWDDLVGGDEVDEPVARERDVLEDVFFRHLKKGSAVSSGRRALERGAATYLAFSRLLVELELGGGAPAGEPGALVGPLAGLVGEGELDFTKAAVDTSDDDLARARLVARDLFEVIARVGAALSRVHGAGHSDSVGRALVTMTESASEQVLAVLLAAADGRPTGLADPATAVEAPRPPLDFSSFARLRALAGVDPAAARLLEPERLAQALTSPEDLAAWWTEASPLANPGGETGVTGPDVDPGEADDPGDGDKRSTPKKKILNDPSGLRHRGHPSWVNRRVGA